MDNWFHLAATVDLSKSPEEVHMYIDGNLLSDNTRKESTGAISQVDRCTRLCLGHYNPCNGIRYSSSADGSSAAYSNLMVFDSLLTPGAIGNLSACGSLGEYSYL